MAPNIVGKVIQLLLKKTLRNAHQRVPPLPHPWIVGPGLGSMMLHLGQSFWPKIPHSKRLTGTDLGHMRLEISRLSWWILAAWKLEELNLAEENAPLFIGATLDREALHWPTAGSQVGYPSNNWLLTLGRCWMSRRIASKLRAIVRFGFGLEKVRNLIDHFWSQRKTPLTLPVKQLLGTKHANLGAICEGLLPWRRRPYHPKNHPFCAEMQVLLLKQPTFPVASSIPQRECERHVPADVDGPAGETRCMPQSFVLLLAKGGPFATKLWPSSSRLCQEKHERF